MEPASENSWNLPPLAWDASSNGVCDPPSWSQWGASCSADGMVPIVDILPVKSPKSTGTRHNPTPNFAGALDKAGVCIGLAHAVATGTLPLSFCRPSCVLIDNVVVAATAAVVTANSADAAASTALSTAAVASATAAATITTTTATTAATTVLLLLLLLYRWIYCCYATTNAATTTTTLLLLLLVL